MVDTGSPTSFVDPRTAALITGKQNIPLRPLAASDLQERFTDFNGNPVQRRGFIEVPVRCGDWTTPRAKFFVLDDGPRQCRLLGANLMSAIGLAPVQKSPSSCAPTPLASIGESPFSPTACTHLAQSEFPTLFSRTGRFKNHVVRTKFRPDF